MKFAFFPWVGFFLLKSFKKNKNKIANFKHRNNANFCVQTKQNKANKLYIYIFKNNKKILSSLWYFYYIFFTVPPKN